MSTAIPITPPADSTRIYTVSRLNREVRGLLESGIPPLWIEAEVSNFSRPSSGHWYFSLKDEGAQVRCAMFRQRNQSLRFIPDNGMKVLARAKVCLYEPRGEYQLMVEHLEPAGEGALRTAFERLKAKLQAEGLFAPERKRPLPPYPRSIGVVTSPTGAAIRDILHVLRRRYGCARVVLYPVPVQGQDAGAQIAQAIRVAGLRAETDVLIIARGGGSLEDLWAFNEEVVARALYDCPIPCVSGVGHEIDFTIADFVADQRAPTPSAAAELVTPDREALWQQLDRLLTRLKHSQQVRHSRQHERQLALLHRLQRCHPQQRLRLHTQRLEELNRRLHQRMNQQLGWQRQQLQHSLNRLTANTPRQRLQQAELRLQQIHQRLDTALKARLDDKQRRLALGVRGLNAFSPLATLERGYAIAHRDNGVILRRADEVRLGEPIQVRLAQGELRCEVKQIVTAD